LEKGTVMALAQSGMDPMPGATVEDAIAKVEGFRRRWYESIHPSPDNYYLSLVGSGVSSSEAQFFTDEYASSYVPYEAYLSAEASKAKVTGASVAEPGDVEDAIITSDGQVIKTDPEDNIYAFKGDVSIAPANGRGGGVSMEPANSMREFSGSPAGYSNQQSSVVNNVTNNYLSQSNFNLSDLLPGSEFDPVGV
jgi:hypothetical protein